MSILVDNSPMLNQQSQNNFRVAIAMSVVAYFSRWSVRINPENHLKYWPVINIY